MPELGDKHLELMERQLAERVTKRVTRDLFRLYAVAGGAVIAVLGFIGWDFQDDLMSEIKDDFDTYVEQQLEEDIEAKRKEIDEQATETRVISRRARKVIQQVEDDLETLLVRVDEMHEISATVQALNDKSKNMIDYYSRKVEPLVDNIDTFTNQLAILAEQVRQLNTVAASVEPDATVEAAQNYEKRGKTIQSVISDTKQAEQRLEQARNKTTVFFQFAGGTRGQAEDLSGALKAKGYLVPGESRHKGAAKKHEVRYFHEDDKAAAKRLADATTIALRELEYSTRDVADIVPKSLVTWRYEKPRLGVLELWVELPQ